jgi:hypothetical protein
MEDLIRKCLALCRYGRTDSDERYSNAFRENNREPQFPARNVDTPDRSNNWKE